MTPIARPPILFIDVIPVHSANDVGGFSKTATRKRGVLFAATLDAEGELRLFLGEECPELAAHLRDAGHVVGYNCLGFDYELIRGQTPFRRPPTTDMMLVLGKPDGRFVQLKHAIRKHVGSKLVPEIQTIQEAAFAGSWPSVEHGMKRRLGLLAQLYGKFVTNSLSRG